VGQRGGGSARRRRVAIAVDRRLDPFSYVFDAAFSCHF